MTPKIGSGKIMNLWNVTNIQYASTPNIKEFEHEFKYIGLLGNDLLNEGI